MRVFLLALLFSSQVFAVFVGPPSTSAGIIERQIESDQNIEKLSPTKPVPSLEIEHPEDEMHLPSDKMIYVDQIRFVGNTLFSGQELMEQIEPFIHREISMKQIQKICEKIQNLYAKKGYVFTKAYIPEQQFKKGTLTIQIIEAKLGSIEVSGNKYYQTSFIENYFTPLCGLPIDLHEIIAKLLLLNELPNINVGAIYRKGKKPATTDLVIQVQDTYPLHLDINTNNYGSNLTTINRSGIQLNYGNAFAQGSNLGLTAVGGWPNEDLRFASANYTLPLNTKGTKIQFSYIYSHFHVNTFQSLDLKGTSQVGSVELDQAVFRTRSFNLDFYVNFDYKSILNFALDQVSANDQIRDLYAGIHLDGVDSSNGRNWLDFWCTCGIPNFLGGMTAVDPECSRIGGGGRFWTANLEYKRLQTINSYLFLILNGSAQGTFYKLPIPQQFYIGGADTVRGYPLAIGLGDNGYFCNAELRMSVWKKWFQLAAFIDHGGTFLNGGGEQAPSPVFLTSGGVGFRFQGNRWIDISFDAGIPITTHFEQYPVIYYFRAVGHAF